MAERGTNRPTEAEVRGLIAKYGEPAAPECPSCDNPMAKEFCPDGEHWFVCHACHKSELVETKHDSDVIAVCEDWLRLNRTERRIEMANPQITKQNWEPPHA